MFSLNEPMAGPYVRDKSKIKYAVLTFSMQFTRHRAIKRISSGISAASWEIILFHVSTRKTPLQLKENIDTQFSGRILLIDGPLLVSKNKGESIKCEKSNASTK